MIYSKALHELSDKVEAVKNFCDAMHIRDQNLASSTHNCEYARLNGVQLFAALRDLRGLPEVDSPYNGLCILSNSYHTNGVILVADALGRAEYRLPVKWQLYTSSLFIFDFTLPDNRGVTFAEEDADEDMLISILNQKIRFNKTQVTLLFNFC